MTVTIQVRRDTSANWVSANHVLHQGEPGLETDTGRFKLGDGSTAWTSLPYAASQLTPTSQAGAYTANPGDLVKANVSGGGWTLNLPNAPAANTIVGAKVTANVATGAPNALTVACQGSDLFEQSGGSTSVTLSLLDQAAAWQYNGGYWTRLSDDLPLGQLDNRYGKVFSPLAFGAAGNGTTDDTTAVTAAFTAAGSAGGIVDLGYSTYLTSSAIPLVTGVHLRGSELGGGGALINNTSDLFSLAGTVSSFTIENCSLTASAGHIVNCAASSTVAFGKIRGCYITQSSASHGIWYMPSGTYLNMLVDGECTLVCNAAATVAPWYVVGLANSNTWQSVRVSAGTGVTVPFFWIECDSASAFSSGNTFRDITAEVCVGGIIRALSVSNLTLECVLGYDVTGSYSASLIYVGTGTGGGRSQDIAVRNSGRIGGTLGSGAYDFQAASTTQAILLENVGPESATASYSVPATYSTIIGGVNNVGFFQSASLNVSGIAPSPAPSRLVGGSTVTGPPASGAWNALDQVTDFAGTVWICTVAGTGSAASWAPAIAAAGIPTASQSQGYLGWTSDPLGGTLLGAPAATTWTAGVLYARRIDVVPNTVASGYVTFQWLTHASMVNSYFSVWSFSGTTITLIGSTADVSALTTGWHRVALSTFPTTLTPGSGVLYVTYMNGTSGVAGGPYTERGAWSQSVPTLSGQLPGSVAGQYRWMQGGSSLTSPAAASPFSLSGASIGVLPFWCALD